MTSTADKDAVPQSAQVQVGGNTTNSNVSRSSSAEWLSSIQDTTRPGAVHVGGRNLSDDDSDDYDVDYSEYEEAQHDHIGNDNPAISSGTVGRIQLIMAVAVEEETGDSMRVRISELEAENRAFRNQPLVDARRYEPHDEEQPSTATTTILNSGPININNKRDEDCFETLRANFKPMVIVFTCLMIFLIVSSTLVVLLLPEDNTGGTNTGEKYEQPAVMWEWHALGLDLVGSEQHDNFGRKVAISGDGNRIAGLACPALHCRLSGNYARVYEWRKGVWEQMGNDFTKCSHLAMNEKGDRIAVGYMTTNEVKTFEWNTESGQWIQFGNTLSGIRGDLAISSDGRRLAIGYASASTYTGQVVIYEWDGDNIEWKKIGKSVLGDKECAYFGAVFSFSSDGNEIIVGAPGYSDGDGCVDKPVGYAQVFVWNSSKGQDHEADWTLLGQTLTGYNNKFGSGVDISQDGKTLTGYNNKFGAGVDISQDGKTIVIGIGQYLQNGKTPGGAIIYSQKSSGDSIEWEQVGEFLVGETDGERFGQNVAIANNGTRVAISSPQSDHGGQQDTGSVHVYDWSGLEWIDISTNNDEKVNNLVGNSRNDRFGKALAMSGNGTRMIVGADLFDCQNAIDCGLVRVFEAISL